MYATKLANEDYERQVGQGDQENHKWGAWRSGGDMNQVRRKSFTRLGMTQATGLKSVRLRESGFGVAGREYGVRTMTVDASGRSLPAEIDGFPVVGVQIRPIRPFVTLPADQMDILLVLQPAHLVNGVRSMTVNTHRRLLFRGAGCFCVLARERTVVALQVHLILIVVT